MGKYFVTTPIYYVNDVPHIGTAYPTIAADILARFHRMLGDEVIFSTGTDENATKVSREAIQRELKPAIFVEQMSAAFQNTWQKLNISYTDFIRTSQKEHHHAVQELMMKLSQNDDIYYSEYEGWYCVPCETHLLENQLVDGLCPDCGRSVEWMKEPGYFFRLSKYADALLQYIENNHDFLQPGFRKNEVIAFIKSGLRDVNITRKSDWGIPLPAELPNSQGLVIYVWYDALINYITVAGYPDNQQKFQECWPADSQIVGKDIFTRFHATMWPAMLMAAGLPLPKTVVAHGFWTIGGEKISKSKHSGKGFRINPLDLAQELVDASGVSLNIAIDAIRYFLFREMPFGADGDFSLEAVYRRYNSDLANDLGNLVNRTSNMIGKYCQGIIPTACELLPQAKQSADNVRAYLQGDVVNYLEALRSIWALLGYLNRFIEEQAPWKLYKTGDHDAVNRIMYTLAEGLRFAALLLYPFTPSVAESIAEQIGWNNPQWLWSELNWGGLAAGSQLPKPQPIFPRIIEEKLMIEESLPVTSAESTEVTTPTIPVIPAETEDTLPQLITIDDFARVQLKIGTIIAAEKHPKADKLIKLQVEMGEEEPRQIIAGIAAVYSPEVLLGKRVIVVANLQPAKLRGEISQGMLLAADMGENGMSLLLPDNPDVPNGSKVR